MKREENKKKRQLSCRKLSFLFGGPEEDRTLDLTDANRTLSQLSYGPKQHIDYKPMFLKCQLLFLDFFAGLQM